MKFTIQVSPTASGEHVGYATSKKPFVEGDTITTLITIQHSSEQDALDAICLLVSNFIRTRPMELRVEELELKVEELREKKEER